MLKMKLRYVGATVLYCGMIYWMSSQSSPPTGDWSLFSFPAADKLAHALLYAGLTTIVSFGLWRSNESLRPALQFWLPVVFSVFYGLSDEIHQLYVAERNFDLMDLLADGIGATIVQVALCKVVWPGGQKMKWGSPSGE